MARTVAVTGASAGIGRASAVEFGRCGDTVVVLARGEKGLAGAAKEVEQAGGRAIPITVDTADETRWGGVVGVGLEFGFSPGWSLAVEYDHLFMGDHNNTFTVSPGLGLVGTSRIDNIRQDVDMGTVRVNYTFGGPVVAKY